MTKQNARFLARVQMNRSIAASIQNLASLCEQRQVTIDYAPGSVIYYVQVDRTSLLLVIQTLLKHAVRLSDSRSSIVVNHKRLRGTRYDDSGDFVQVTIRVCGRGVSEKMLQAVAEQFDQIRHSLGDRAQPPAADAKLSHCQRFIRSSGGNVWVKGKLGRGLDISFVLPLLKEIRLRRRNWRTLATKVRVVSEQPAGEVAS